MAVNLLNLPSEVLLEIISYLDFPFFAADIGRLTLSRRWYDLALSSLRNLQLALGPLQLPWVPAIINLVHPSIISLSLVLTPDKSRTAEELRSLQATLRALANNILKNCRSLRNLSIALGYLWDVPPMTYTAHSLLVSVPQNLTTLCIDTSLCSWTGQPRNRPAPKWHLCDTINKIIFLGSLRTLHCRMISACEKLLALPEDISHDNPVTSLKLKRVVISLTWCIARSHRRDIDKTCPHVPCNSLRFTRSCEEGVKDYCLPEAITQQAVLLAERMKKPEVVRVWTYNYLGSGSKMFEMMAFDALACKQ
ncbi:hypothetical protein B0T16DRAFT_411823 [Cercophora newfieldiana]|uniref:F-box domain-containing protein n=1 Tax=Cercophora newfieldiana TaxID=92897 RepID=A0AA39Y5D8_9PEZI|nr:hypothetical protein B0T16DRAFT_411823 [Cercophora newfieldiana]